MLNVPQLQSCHNILFFRNVSRRFCLAVFIHRILGRPQRIRVEDDEERWLRDVSEPFLFGCCSVKRGRRRVMVIAARLFPIQIATAQQPRRPTARLQRLRGRTPSRKVRKNVIAFFCFFIFYIIPPRLLVTVVNRLFCCGKKFLIRIWSEHLQINRNRNYSWVSLFYLLFF